MKQLLHLVLCGMLIAAVSHAQNTPTFSLTIVALHPTVHLASPLKVEVTKTNTSTEPIPCSVKSWSNITYVIRDSSRTLVPETERGLWMHGKDPRHPLAGSVFAFKLDPGHVLRSEETINELYKMTGPGSYTVQAIEYDPIAKLHVESNVISVAIEP